MKLAYERPMCRISLFEQEDVITTSGLITADFEGGYNNWDPNWNSLLGEN